jgi:hypothetical protein
MRKYESIIYRIFDENKLNELKGNGIFDKIELINFRQI